MSLHIVILIVYALDDHEFHFQRLMELIQTQNQKYSDSILHTIFVMRGLLNVKNEVCITFAIYII